MKVKMFTQARIKLTGWYLVVIMVVSLVFSGFIYNGISLELVRRKEMIERRFEIEQPEFVLPRGPRPIILEELESARENVLILLIYANSAIFLFSALLGYFLAGRTLKPIEQALEEQKRFVADASHELKTPLTALQTEIEVALRNRHLSLKEARKVLKNNLEETEDLTKLTGNLLSLTRYQSGKNGLNFTRVNFLSLVNLVLKRIEPLAKKRKITIQKNIANLQIKADRVSLEKLLLILLDNAVKYSPKGKKITLKAKKQSGYLVMKVIDQGMGITKKDLPYIFNRFYQASSSRTRTANDGFGLGLSLAKEIVKMHKGTIKAASNRGKGSVFTVKLPLK